LIAMHGDQRSMCRNLSLLFLNLILVFWLPFIYAGFHI
jgi:hypothetical protein